MVYIMEGDNNVLLFRPQAHPNCKIYIFCIYLLSSKHNTFLDTSTHSFRFSSLVHLQFMSLYLHDATWHSWFSTALFTFSINSDSVISFMVISWIALCATSFAISSMDGNLAIFSISTPFTINPHLSNKNRPTVILRGLNGITLCHT